MAEFRMPSLGADMDEGTLVEWLVAPGDEVSHGQIVAVVDTAKAAIEVEVFSDGVVEELLVEPGTTVAVGTPWARLSGEGLGTAERPAAPPVTSPIVRHLAHERGVDLETVHGTGPDGTITRSDVAEAASQPVPPAASAPPPSPSPAADRRDASRFAASPFARRRAGELGVDLARVTGSGADGAISVVDVERAAASGSKAPEPQPTPDQAPSSVPKAKSAKPATSDQQAAAAKQAAMRAAIGALMARSKREIPHYYLRTTIDLATSMTWLRERNAERGVEHRLVPAVLLLKAAALAARQVPEVNGFYVDDHYEPSEHVHLGVAVSLRGGGLVAPAIHDADRLDLDALMVGLKDVVSRARSGRLRGSQMSDPTITVTNLGDQGVEEVQGVIYPPQVALVGFGRVVERPWALNGLLGVHPVVVATLAADHRVTDGHRGGRYLTAVDALLQHPDQLDTA